VTALAAGGKSRRPQEMLLRLSFERVSRAQ
jgi:hypothetical protein